MVSSIPQVERVDGLQHMHIPSGQTYVTPGEAYVEGDASSASYFLAGMNITFSFQEQRHLSPVKGVSSTDFGRSDFGVVQGCLLTASQRCAPLDAP